MTIGINRSQASSSDILIKALLWKERSNNYRIISTTITTTPTPHPPNFRSKYNWDTKCLQRTGDIERGSISMNCRITKTFCGFVPTAFYHLIHHCFTALPGRCYPGKNPLTCASFSDSWYTCFKCRPSPSTLAHSVLMAGNYFEEACKNKFKITWEGLREEEAEVRQTPCKQPEHLEQRGRWKHDHGITIPQYCFLQMYAIVQSETTLTSFWSDPIHTKAAGNILTNSAAQTCLFRWIHMHIMPYTPAFLKLALQSKWQ